jgi:histidine triad (HIT) family protein
MEDCIFCRIASGQVPAALVYQDDDCAALRDLNPQAPTHVLIVPRRHIATLNDLTTEDDGLAGRMVLVAAQIARDEGVAEDGYRLVWNCNAGAGQSVFHLHLHLLGGRLFAWPPG